MAEYSDGAAGRAGGDRVGLEDVQKAAATLAGVAHRTPVLTSTRLDERAGSRLYLKAENLQRTGSFKFRGAFNRLSALSAEERRRGVVAFSSGNHGQALALAGQLLDVPVSVFMAGDGPRVKQMAAVGYGAKVRFYGPGGDRHALAAQAAAQQGAVFVPPYEDALVIAGQGTAALELLDEVSDLDTLVVPIGGGGLISGCAVAAKGINPAIRVVGVEPEAGNDTYLSVAAGRRITIDLPDTIADGLRTTSPGERTFEILTQLVDEVVLVSEAEIVDAVTTLALTMKTIAEPSGAVGVAAVLAGRVTGRRVGVILSGGNVDPDRLARIITGGVETGAGTKLK
jgi:threo-3-hydroxy-L-aspartate ammonia-lyase